MDEANFTLWSFTPPDHSAHPGGVKRAVVKRDGAIYNRMSTKRGASKTECDKLKQFRAIAIRCDKLARSFLAGVYLVSTLIGLI